MYDAYFESVNATELCPIANLMVLAFMPCCRSKQQNVWRVAVWNVVFGKPASRSRGLNERHSRCDGLTGPAHGVSENHRVALCREPFGALALPVAPERVYGPPRQADASAAVRGLGGFERLPPRPVMRARWTRITLRLRSRSDQNNPPSSPILAPVVKPKT